MSRSKKMIATEPSRSEVPLTTLNTFLKQESKFGDFHFTSNKNTIHIACNNNYRLTNIISNFVYQEQVTRYKDL
jgi:hypothetical protein